MNNVPLCVQEGKVKKTGEELIKRLKVWSDNQQQIDHFVSTLDPLLKLNLCVCLIKEF